MDVLESSEFPAFDGLQFLAGFPEHKVALPGGSRPSQNDIFVVARNKQRNLISMTVEGKVAEPFGPLISDWRQRPTSGKDTRLRYLLDRLELNDEGLEDIRYQLLHRTVSAIKEAERWGAKIAVMLVHSFSPTNDGFEDYCRFLNLFSVEGQINSLAQVKRKDSLDLYLGWVNESCSKS